jgi:Flp pilus assembly protein TadG
MSILHTCVNPGRHPGSGGRTIRLSRRCRGVATVEFALAAIPFFIMLFAIIEGGRAGWTYGTAAHLAKEGSRFAIVRGADCVRLDRSVCTTSVAAVEAYVRERAIGCNAIQVTTTWVPNNQPGSMVRVRVDCPFKPIAWPFGARTLTGTSEMTITF